MLLNLKITYSILLIIVILIILRYHRSNFQNISANTEYETLTGYQKKNLLNNFNLYNKQDAINTREIKILKVKNSNQIVIQNYTQTEKLNDFQYQKNIKSEKIQNKLKLVYQLLPLQNTTSLMSSMLISNPMKTSKTNKKYGFILKLDADLNPQHNLGEFTIDFTQNKLKSINNVIDIQNKTSQKTYQELERKTVHLFTKYTSPADILPYFTKGTHGKDIEVVIRFLDATNIDYLRNLPNKRFNILDENKNPVFTYCLLDNPYCGVNLKPTGNVKGRDKLIVGKLNHQVGEYTAIDSQEYSKYKADRASKQEEEKKKTAEGEIAIIKTKNPTYDMLTHNQRIMVKQYDTEFYQELVNKKKEELLARNDKNYGDIDIKFISENNLQEDFNLNTFIGGYSQGLIAKTQERYRNMEEHFTDTVTTADSNNFGFSGEKYLQYQEYEKCMSKENRDRNTSKMVSKQYSPILEDNLMIKKDKTTLDKIKEKMGFKCRKHYKENDERYFYGGIDFDGQSKCYGEASACKIFPTENDCLDLEKELTKVEGFTGSLTTTDTIEHFASSFQAEKDTIYRLAFMSGGKKYYLKKGSDVYRQEREYNVGKCGAAPYTTGWCSPAGRFVIGHTENVNEAIGFGYEPKNTETVAKQWHNSPSQCMFFLHNLSKYYMIYQGAAQFVRKSNGELVKHYLPLAQHHSKYSCFNLVQMEGKYYLLGRPNDYLQYILELQTLVPYKNKPDATAFIIEKNEALTLTFQIQNKVNQAQSALQKTQSQAQSALQTTQSQAQSALQTTQTQAQSALQTTQSQAQSALQTTQSQAQSALQTTQTQAQNNLTETVKEQKIMTQMDMNKSKEEVETAVSNVKTTIKNMKAEQQQEKILQNKKLLQIENEKKYQETVEKMRKQELASSEQKNLSDKIAGLNKLVNYDSFDSAQAGYIGADLEEDYQKYNFLNCIPYEREDITCKHIVKNMEYNYDTKNIELKNQTLVDIITLDEANEDNISNILRKHEKIAFNKQQAIDLKEKKNLDDSEIQDLINYELKKPFDYLIEPCYEEFKSINSHLIFENFKIKFRMANVLDSENSIPGMKEVYYTTLQIIKNNEIYQTIVDTDNIPIRLEKSDSIYIYIDKSVNLCLEVMSSIEGSTETYTKSQIVKFKIKGKYGDNINLFLQTNNQQIFESIHFSEQIENIALPYDPYLDVEFTS